MSDSNATGVDGNQADNSATRLRRGLRLRAQRHHLDPAGLPQGLQHRGRRPLRPVGRGLGRHGGGRGIPGGQQRHRGERQPERQQRLRRPARPTSSRGAARPGPSRPTSRPPTPDADDWFGQSVAVSGDTVVVGAVYEDSNATGVNGDQSDNSADDSGAAYVFMRSGTTWTQQAYLKASNTEPSDYFGVVGGGLGRHGGGRSLDEDSNATGVNGNQSRQQRRLRRRGLRLRAQRRRLGASRPISRLRTPRRVTTSVTRSLYLGDTVVVSAYVESAGTASGVNGNQSRQHRLGCRGGLRVRSRASTAASSSLTYTGVWLDADADGGTPLAATLSCADDSTLVAGKTVGFFVDLDHNDVFASPDELVGSGTTDAGGHVTVDWHHDGALIGTFPVKASFAGTTECQASSAKDTVVLGTTGRHGRGLGRRAGAHTCQARRARRPPPSTSRSRARSVPSPAPRRVSPAP